jgi:hypothetical protein
VQVSPSIGLTFARALRSFRWHNPNIVMVGEIRDLETAEVFSFAVTELIPQSPKIDILKPRGLPTTGSSY